VLLQNYRKIYGNFAMKATACLEDSNYRSLTIIAAITRLGRKIEVPQGLSFI
jgi:hypothetical protein